MCGLVTFMFYFWKRSKPEGKGKGKSLSRVWLFATPWTAAHQAPPSMGFSRQEYWSGVPLPSPMNESAVAAELLQSCPTLCDPIDGSPPDSPVPGILQTRTLEWVATSFSWRVILKTFSEFSISKCHECSGLLHHEIHVKHSHHFLFSLSLSRDFLPRLGGKKKKISPQVLF